MLREVVELFGTGALELLPRQEWDVRRAGEAFALMSRAKHVGKLVLSVPSAPAAPATPVAPATSGAPVASGAASAGVVSSVGAGVGCWCRVVRVCWVGWWRGIWWGCGVCVGWCC
ncbi:zinc-binding dehydrogenase [Streptomyces olivaceus]|uniref:zinc-binding dehydrogenase n=1 Tax=Streptomyces olivaceus TaxID=47716 RepID=UPI00389B005A